MTNFDTVFHKIMKNYGLWSIKATSYIFNLWLNFPQLRLKLGLDCETTYLCKYEKLNGCEKYSRNYSNQN